MLAHFVTGAHLEKLGSCRELLPGVSFGAVAVKPSRPRSAGSSLTAWHVGSLHETMTSEETIRQRSMQARRTIDFFMLIKMETQTVVQR